MVPESNPQTAFGPSRRPLFLARFAIVVAMVVATLWWALETTGPEISADTPRPWAIVDYRARTAEVVRPGTSKTADPWPLFERVAVHGAERAHLPGPGDWSMQLSAWKAPGTPWLSPSTGEPMDFDPGEDAAPAPVSAAFEFIVDVETTADITSLESRLRTARPLIFDRETGVSLSGRAHLHVTGRRAQIVLDSGCAHRADLLLALPITLPDLVRVQFVLPPPLPLPVVDDLAQLPPPRVPKRPWPADFTARYYEELGQRLQVSLEGTYPRATQTLPQVNTAGEALERHLDLNRRDYQPRSFSSAPRKASLLDWLKHQVRSRM